MTTYQKTYPFKRGDTFSATCTYKVAGVPQPLSTQQIASQLRTESGTLVQTLVVTKDPNQTLNVGKFTLTLSVPSSSSTFPAPTNLYCDIQVTDNNVVVSTSTFIIPVVVDITR
jgi:hypothetical protein